MFVDDDAPAGGDGATRETALPTISAALSFAGPGDVIALATGTYEATDATLLRDQTLWGACVNGTRLTSSVESVDARVFDLSVSEMQLGSSDAGRGITVADARVTLDRVRLERTIEAGLLVAEKTPTSKPRTSSSEIRSSDRTIAFSA
jgi:hypothetical protein